MTNPAFIKESAVNKRVALPATIDRSGGGGVSIGLTGKTRKLFHHSTAGPEIALWHF
jgi:hypothetical protein